LRFTQRENFKAHQTDVQILIFFERMNLHLLPSRLYCRLWNHTKSCLNGSRA